uniref:RNI-like protein n=1 Tax=Moniliophthora roreri TaxID=221103 RepID=A0A0W0F6R5_MONRR
MSTSSSASSPSSSAVTIPIPGKSILKKPPPPQTSLFSRITRFLPQSQSSGSTFGIRTSTSGTSASTSSGSGNGGNEGNGNTVEDGRPLKRAHFILPQIATVYPISSLNPPSTPTLKEEKRAVEEREAERRRRVVRGNNSSTGSGTPTGDDDWWSMDKVCSFYEECCVGCDEPPDPAIKAAFKNAENTNPRTVDFSGIQLTPASASILADVFTIEWGLRKLTLKPMLHSLLISNSLTFLSVASNRRLKTPAFRLVGAYVAKATSLQFLDLSQNPLDKKSIEYIVAALTQPPNPGLASLRLDDCALKPGALDVLARAVRTSSLRNISLRHNKINATGAIALSVMIRDYPDSIPVTGLASSSTLSPQSPTSSLLLSPTSTITTTTSLPGSSSTTVGSRTGTPSSSLTPSPASSVTSLPLTSTLTPHPPQPLSPQPQPHAGPVLPPPTHPSLQPMQTTYTPYVPRAKRGKPAPPTTASSPSLGNVPIITTSVRGGVTAVTANGVSTGIDKVVSAVKGVGGNSGRTPPGRSNTYNQGPSAALLDKVRALDALPRLGSLRTLDLKGNDLRNGTTYLAQVLKRNRTLKVLNLSENKLDVACLVAIADALKYNTCLETLDLSRNPCCGSGSSSGSGSLTKDRDRLIHNHSTLARAERSPSELEGIQSLRTSLTLTTSLKRLFLSSTNLSTQGAIALAEFLPESRSLLHLDLTGNDDLGVAGVMALNEGLKRNRVMRCLDLEVPPGAEEEILNTCIRNTEEAEKIAQQEQAQGSRSKAALWGMIEESELAKSVRFTGDEAGMIDTDVVLRARGCIRLLNNFIKNPSIPLHSPQATPSGAAPPPLSPQTPISGLFSPTSSTFSPFSLLPLRNQSSPPKEEQQIPLTPEELINKSRGVIKELGMVITSGQDDVGPERLEELLSLNDELTGLTTKAEETAVTGRAPTPTGNPVAPVMGEGRQGRPALTLQGLGIKFNNTRNGSTHDEKATNGGVSSTEDEELPSPTTPKIDKGKQKAEPEPIEHEKVLSPTASFLIAESNSDGEDDEDDGMRGKFPPFVVPGPGEEGYDLEGDDATQSPSSIDRSRSWVEEEGEVFRKGNVLLGPEEMEGEYAGEDLRRELLEAMVERPAPRNLSIDEFGVELPPEESEAPPVLPAEPAKPSPRPYISRSRSSSSSIMNLASPTVEKAAAMPLPASPRLDSSGSYFQGVAKSPLSPNIPSSLPGTPTRETSSPRPYARMRSGSSLDTK